jgi:hypothetical protein
LNNRQKEEQDRKNNQRPLFADGMSLNEGLELMRQIREAMEAKQRTKTVNTKP